MLQVPPNSPLPLQDRFAVHARKAASFTAETEIRFWLKSRRKQHLDRYDVLSCSLLFAISQIFSKQVQCEVTWLISQNKHITKSSLQTNVSPRSNNIYIYLADDFMQNNLQGIVQHKHLLIQLKFVHLLLSQTETNKLTWCSQLTLLFKSTGHIFEISKVRQLNR